MSTSSRRLMLKRLLAGTAAVAVATTFVTPVFAGQPERSEPDAPGGSGDGDEDKKAPEKGEGHKKGGCKKKRGGHHGKGGFFKRWFGKGKGPCKGRPGHKKEESK